VPRFVPERRYGSKLHTYALAHQMGAFDAISREAASELKTEGWCRGCIVYNGCRAVELYNAVEAVD